MRGGKLVQLRRSSGAIRRSLPAAMLSASLFLPVPANANEGGTIMTGKVMMDRMPSKEFEAFVTGMVEGMAYARFRKDTMAAGKRSEEGMKCIRRWYHDTPRNYLVVLDAFQQHHEHTAWVVLGVLLKKECGE